MSQDFYVGDGRGAGCCAVTGITAGNTTPSSVAAVAVHFVMGSLRPWCARRVSRLRKSGQDDKWSFCLTAGTL